MRSTLVLVSSLAVLAPPADAEEAIRFHELPLDGGGTLQYALVLPVDYDSERVYPALLALPPGAQDARMVAAGLHRYWGRQAAERGWLVVTPVAPDGVSFFQGSERHLPGLLDHIREHYPVEHGRFHLAGNSNGGRGAFRIVLDHPEEFLSLTVLPGYPPAEGDMERLSRLAGMPVRMFVGGEDRGWVQRMEETRKRLEAEGGDVELTVFPGEGHVPPSLDGGRFMRDLEKLRMKLAEK